jgi:hypothetical protein
MAGFILDTDALNTLRKSQKHPALQSWLERCGAICSDQDDWLRGAIRIELWQKPESLKRTTVKN